MTNITSRPLCHASWCLEHGKCLILSLTADNLQVITMVPLCSLHFRTHSRLYIFQFPKLTTVLSVKFSRCCSVSQNFHEVQWKNIKIMKFYTYWLSIRSVLLACFTNDQHQRSPLPTFKHYWQKYSISQVSMYVTLNIGSTMVHFYI